MSGRALRVLDGPFRAVLDAGFAGPRTTWRAVNVDDGSTWEACALGAMPARGYAEPPRGTQLALADDGEAFVLAPGAGGATLGEVVDATVAQGARLDPSFAVHALAELAPQLLVDELRFLSSERGLDAVSLDHVLVGFDGSVLPRGHLPWWGPRERARAGPAFEASSAGQEQVRLFGELAAELLSSRRWTPGPPAGSPAPGPLGPGIVFPSLPRKLRREARRVVARMLEDTLTPAGIEDVEELLAARRTVDVRAVREDVVHLRAHAEPVPAADLGALVRNLFAERWHAEQRTRALLDAARAG